MVMTAVRSFPVHGWNKPVLHLSKTSFPSIKVAEHLFCTSDDLQWAQFNSLGPVGYHAEFLSGAGWEE